MLKLILLLPIISSCLYASNHKNHHKAQVAAYKANNHKNLDLNAKIHADNKQSDIKDIDLNKIKSSDNSQVTNINDNKNDKMNSSDDSSKTLKDNCNIKTTTDHCDLKHQNVSYSDEINTNIGKDGTVDSVSKNKKIVSNMESTLINREILQDFEKNLDLSKHKQLNISILPTKFSQVWLVNNSSNVTSIELRFKNEGNRSFPNTPKLVNAVLANLIEGTSSKSATKIKQIIEDKSIDLSFQATQDDVIVTVSFLSKYLNTVIDLLIELFTQATLPEDKIKSFIQEYRLNLLQSKFNTYDKAYEKLSNMVMVPEYRYDIENIVEKLGQYKKQDIDQCYKKLFNPKNAAITIVSGLSIDKLIFSIDKLYEAIKGKKNDFKGAECTTELVKSEQFVHVEVENPQSTVLFVLPGIDQKNKNKYALKAALYLFGGKSFNSRLFDNLREKRGLVYTTWAKENVNDLQSMIIGCALTRPENVYKVIETIKGQIEDFARNGISENELHEFKISKFSDFVLDSSNSILSYVTNQRRNGVPFTDINNPLDQYMQLTVEDVNREIKSIFDSSKVVFVECGTDLGKKQNIKQEGNKIKQEVSNNAKEELNIQNKILNSKSVPGSASVSNQLNITENVLDNGLRVIIAPLKTKDSVFFGIGYYVGDADDPKDLMGISHFLEHVMFKNTTNLPNGEIKTYTDKFNQLTNAWTADDMTFYWQKGNKQFLDMNMKIEAERMTNLKFDQEEINKECGAIIEERKMRCEADPKTRYLGEAMNKVLYLYSNYSDAGIGQVKNIKACNVENIKKHYEKYYKNPKNAFILLVGDITQEEGVKLVQKNFGHIPAGENIVRDRTIDPEDTGLLHTIHHHAPDTTTKQMDFIYKIPRKHIQTLKQYLTLQIACNILAGGGTSLLYRDLVEKKKLAYDVSVLTDKKSFDSILVFISIQLAHGVWFPEIEKNYIKLLDDRLHLEIKPERVEREKTKMLDSIDTNMENPYAVQNIIIAHIYAGHSIDEIKNIRSIIQSITVDDVRKLADESLRPMNRILTIKQQPKTKAAFYGYNI